MSMNACECIGNSVANGSWLHGILDPITTTDSTKRSSNQGKRFQVLETKSRNTVSNQLKNLINQGMSKTDRRKKLKDENAPNSQGKLFQILGEQVWEYRK